MTAQTTEPPGGVVGDRLETPPADTAPAAAAADGAEALAAWLFGRLDVGERWLGDEAAVRRANAAASEALRDRPVFELHAGRLTSRRPADRQRLRRVLAKAAGRGATGLVRLGACGEGGTLALHALQLHAGRTSWVCLLDRRRPASRLAVRQFAQACALTTAESAVLWHVCVGRRPHEIAEPHDVATSAARTRIRAVHEKAGSRTIRALIESLAHLPPVHGTEPDVARAYTPSCASNAARPAFRPPFPSTVCTAFPEGTTEAPLTTFARSPRPGIAAI
ncbi:helix-turn-helix transcriptional regulator [Azohydromonas sediminis]|uniref:helix-turn-helix transcriptional regulator n=1 Tax=Azohydromonas sediminis TaxID=2259674 RepID=UPI000E648E20|nr:hypothetical protein [Azohydromonas sediminis]